MDKTMLLSQSVVEAVAEQEGVEPAELEPPLYEVVNPDALDNLFWEDERSRGAVLFMYKDYRVVVDSTDTVRLERDAESPLLAVL